MLPYPLYKQIVRFLLSGTLATLVHWSVFMCLGTGVFSLTINALFASSVGALCAAVVNYFLQYHLVFASQATYRQTLFPYLLSVSISFWLKRFVFLHTIANKVVFLDIYSGHHNGLCHGGEFYFIQEGGLS